MVRGIAVVIALVFAWPASARAADVNVDANGVLHYAGSPGKRSNVRFTELAADTIRVEQFPSTPAKPDDDNLAPGTGCTAGNPSTCTGVVSALIDGGDQSDRLEGGWTDDSGTFFGLNTIPVVMLGGDGNDALAGGAPGDSIDGGAGDDTIDGFAGDDTLRGGDGNDDLKPNVGSDTLVGGDGIDTATYGRRLTPSYSLDGLRNDGAAGENDLIGADVENVEAAADIDAQVVTITGDGRANRLTVQAGRGNITGGDGADILEGASQDDLINARDGSPDVVICNGGTDTVLADTLDTISPSCENVQVQATPGGAFDDRPPSLAWATPVAGAEITANAITVLSVSAADDRGLAKVQFYDDDRLVCELTAAPFNCAYQPRGGDVGRNTLVAIATDGAGQTTSAVRAITVRRFAAKDMTLTLRPGRDRRKPYKFSLTGKITRPDPVSPSQGCSGTITFSAKRATKLISTKRVTLTRTCEYKATFTFRTRTAPRVRFQAKFSGNEVLSGASSKVRTARLG
jgi:Ca2+-binding RTX toxin-like protein